MNTTPSQTPSHNATTHEFPTTTDSTEVNVPTTTDNTEVITQEVSTTTDNTEVITQEVSTQVNTNTEASNINVVNSNVVNRPESLPISLMLDCDDLSNFIVPDNAPIEIEQAPHTPVIEQSAQDEETEEESLDEELLGSDDDSKDEYSSGADDSPGSLKDFIVNDSTDMDLEEEEEEEEKVNESPFDDSQEDTDTEDNEALWESGAAPNTMAVEAIGVRRSSRVRRAPQRYMDPHYGKLMLEDIEPDDIEDILSETD